MTGNVSAGNGLEIQALRENLSVVQEYMDEKLEAADIPMKVKLQLDLALEEIFVNIVDYAYAPGTGTASVKAELSDDGKQVVLTFKDCGKPYDPTAKEDPDLTLSAEERGIGGLGIYMTKKIMDKVEYAYRDGYNILRLTKNL